MANELRRIKALYELYNVFNYKKLKYLIPLYQQYGVHKRFFSSLSSSAFPKDSITDHPWLDKEDSATALIDKPAFIALSAEVKSAIIDWSNNGFAVLKGFYSDEKVNSVERSEEHTSELQSRPHLVCRLL